MRWGLIHLLKVKLFPNPHIRTTGFFINSDDLLEVKVNKEKLVEKLKLIILSQEEIVCQINYLKKVSD